MRNRSAVLIPTILLAGVGCVTSPPATVAEERSAAAGERSAAAQVHGRPAGEHRSPTLEAVAFMAGCWRGGFGDGGVIEERYTPPEGGLMLGTTRFLRDGRAVQFEFTTLRDDSLGVVLTPYPGGVRSEHDFRLESASPGRAVFVAPEHDFPKRVLYTRNPGGTHTARIDGGEASAQVREWVMEPVGCG